MKPHTVFPVNSPEAPEPPEARAERLLRGMQKVINHDLPNQMVVVQSLLQLLQMEELDRLSPDGREYVERLTSVARKAAGMVRFLKEMGRLQRYEPQLEDVTLAALARELRAELNQLCPDRVLEYQWDWQVPSVRADYRPLSQALIALLQGYAEGADASCVIQGTSRDMPPWVELEFRVLPAALRDGRAGEQRLEVLLAREWLAAWGAELTLDPDVAGRFSVRVPR